VSEFFEPPPPPEPQPVYRPPPWIAPPAAYLGAPLPLQFILARTGAVVIAVQRATARGAALEEEDEAFTSSDSATAHERS
jgi:hypothetical protein